MFGRFIRRLIVFLVLALLVVSIGGVVLYSRYPLYYKSYIGEFADKYDIDPYLVISIINVESGYDKDAVSRKDARGLMQIAESTGEWAAEKLEIENYDKEILFDPKTNIEIGTWYLKNLAGEFDAKRDLVLAAYNGGSGNVNKWLKDKEYSSDGKKLDKIPFKETENYLKKVKSDYESYKKLYKDIDFSKEEYNSFFINYIYKLKSIRQKL